MENKNAVFTASFDGSTKTNPGDGGYGLVIRDPSGKEFIRAYGPLRGTTSNRAEYSGLIQVLKLAHGSGIKQIRITTDSKLVANQVNRIYRVNSGSLLPYFTEAREWVEKFDLVELIWQRRINNKEAHHLADLGVAADKLVVEKFRNMSELNINSKDVLGIKYPVLDHGYVMLVDYMGSDDAIVEAARVSYGEGTKKTRDDAGLIDYLMRHHHTSPFEMCTLKFEVKLPIFVERQWVRHRTCSMNEISGRYSELPAEFYIPELDVVKAQSKSNKQGREEELDSVDVFNFVNEVKDNGECCFESYQEALRTNVARELARIQLPVGTYTKKVWQMNLHNLFHFLKLRTDSHAQWEIRAYAHTIEEIVRRLFPKSYSSWKNHIKDSLNISCDEMEIIKNVLEENNIDIKKFMEKSTCLSTSRQKELEIKLKRLI